jgi:hypothetical protein
VAADRGEKAATYARGGVQEYILFDLEGHLLPEEPLWARRLRPEGGGMLLPWVPESDGRWHSAFGFALAPEGLLLRVYDRHGTPQRTHADTERLLEEEQRRRLEAEQEQQAEQRRRLEAEQERLEAEQERLEADQRRREEQQRRLEAEQEQQAEQRRRREAEQRLAALEDELRRLRGSDT